MECGLVDGKALWEKAGEAPRWFGKGRYNIEGEERQSRSGFIYTHKKDRERRAYEILPQLWGSVAIFPVDTVVKRKVHNPMTKRQVNARGRIVGLSEASARRLVFTARNVVGFRNMLTLTYPAEFPTDGKLVKKHWSVMRKWLIRRNISGLWWLEFQERGAPHLHVYITGKVNKDEVRAHWYKVVGSGDERHAKAGTRIEAIRKPHAVAAYAAKYAGKQSQKDVPNGFANVGRLWGLFGGLKLRADRIESGPLEQIAPLIRQVRKLDNQKRMHTGQRTRKDRGLGSFTSYGGSPTLSRSMRC